MRSPATTSCSACGSTSTSRGSSTGTSDRPTSRRRWTSSRCGPWPGCATTPRRFGRASPPRSTIPLGCAWLDAQLVALETHAAALAGEPLPYLEHVARCFAYRPARRPDAEFEAAATRLDELLPGDGPLADRLEAWDRRFEIAVERLPGVIDPLVTRFRARAADLFGLPEGEDLRVSLVSGQPWSGYNWYDGGRRSRVDINTDLPVRVPDLIGTVAHETYPGHHLEHAWKEADLVDGRGRLEASILLINTPECLVSEGLADLGRTFAVPDEDAVDLLIETFGRAGLALAADPAAARDAADGPSP